MKVLNPHTATTAQWFVAFNALQAEVVGLLMGAGAPATIAVDVAVEIAHTAMERSQDPVACGEAFEEGIRLYDALREKKGPSDPQPTPAEVQRQTADWLMDVVKKAGRGI